MHEESDMETVGFLNPFVKSVDTSKSKRFSLKHIVFRTALATIFLGAVILTAICTTMDDENNNRRHHSSGDITLKIMSFNIWYGGNQVNLQDTANAIINAGADIVGVQEADANLYKLAELAGLPYVDERRFIVSRFPIYDSGDGYRKAMGAGPYGIHGLDPDAVHAWIVVSPYKMIAFINTHLWWDPYGPDAVNGGRSEQEVLALEEKARGEDWRALAGAVTSLLTGNQSSPSGQGPAPVFLTGDFNSPSHLDWIEAAVNTRPQIKYALQWPSSLALTNAGLVDTYRDVHPDPVASPGITYTPGQPAPQPVHSETLHDRIDFLYVGGAAKTVTVRPIIPVHTELYHYLILLFVPFFHGQVIDSTILGSKSSECRKWESKESVTELAPCAYPWPSDHRAVLSTVTVKPIGIIPLIAVSRRRVRRYKEDVEVCVQLPEDTDAWSVVLVTAGGSALEDSDVLMTFSPEPMTERRCNRFGTSALPEGEYDAVLMREGSDQELHRVRFAIITTETKMLLSATVNTATNTVLVHWQHSPGDRHDFVAVYPASSKNVYAPLGMQFVGGRFSGNTTLDLSDTSLFADPLRTGTYNVMFMSNDQFVELARCSFEIL
jgi:endonuclease/exonuclease/phosphatase family metal-dependent hydrolase